MKFGLVYSYQSLTGEWDVVFENSLEQIALAEELGFDSVLVSEHHLVEDNGYFPSVMACAAAIAARTRKIRVGTGVLLLPLHHPVAVAEDTAVIDIIAKGRFILGVGLGYRPEEYAAFGVPLRERASRFAESLGLVKRLLTERNVTHQGKYWQIADVTVMPRPIQKPAPPVWISAKAEPAVRRAARMADAWFADPVTPLNVLKQRVAAYKETLREVGKDFDSLEFPLMREAYVADDGEKAWEEAREGMFYNYREYLGWGHLQDEQGVEIKGASSYALETLRKRFVVGSPDDCIQQLKVYQRELGVNYFVFRMQFPGLEHQKVMRAIRLMGQEVLPRLNGG